MKSLLKPLVVLVGLVATGPAIAECTGNVTIGEGDSQITTKVPNKAVGNACLNDLIIDTIAEGANYGSQIEFDVALGKLVGEWIKNKTISVLQAVELLIAGARSDVGKTIEVRIIGINDFHGNLLSPGNFSGKPAGGADYLAGYVAADKVGHPNNVVVAAGDLIGASPLVSALFHDEGTIEALNRVGLEFSSVGNHEFDEGSSELLRMQEGGCHPTDPNSCQGAKLATAGFPAAATPVPFEGAKFKYLAANVIVDATGKTLFPAYAVKSFKGHRVAFIGMTLKDTPTIVTPTGVAGLTFNDEADTVNALIPELRRHGVGAVVVLVHQGASGALSDINGCVSGAGNDPIQGIVAQLDDRVDVVISAHSHLAYNCMLPNRSGRLIPVTQASAFGRVLTDVDMTLDTRSGRVIDVSANNKVVDRTNATIAASSAIAGIAAGYNNLASPIANLVIGSITADVSNTPDTTGEKPAGDLIADAQLAATQAPEFGGAQLALMNTGGVRASGFVFSQISGTEPPGDVTYGEAFTVQPFGNALVTMTLTAQQLKDVLEQEFQGCQIAGEPIQSLTDRVLQVSNAFKFSWSASTPASTCNKVTDISLNGTDILKGGVFKVPTSTTYRITVNNFMSAGGDGFTVLRHGTDLLGGAQDIDALAAYLANFNTETGHSPYDPSAAALNKPRITRLP